jgi:UDP-3-O-[3-hydroxymyristoyl] N-acetylglucosamine deacetylase
VNTSAQREQHTLGEPCDFAGVGLHTGGEAEVRVAPQPPGTGLVFRLDGAVMFPATAEYVVDTSRATVLGTGGRTVSTVEHLLSALAGMGIDNALIDVAGPEIPVLDGSAAVFVDAFARAGVVAQGLARRTLRIERPRVYRDGDSLVALFPGDDWRVRCAVDFPPPVGAQYLATAIDPAAYRRGIAAARTWGYAHEVEALQRRGLARGGSLDNALVFAPEGPMTPLRQSDEVAAHKVLDLIGDFALLGARPGFTVVALRSGHALHARVTRDLLREAATLAS